MKKLFYVALIGLVSISSSAQIKLDYYLPANVNYNQSIPTPESVIGHQVGEWLITHDKLVQYMEVLAAVSDRAVLQVYGYSYEKRPLLHLIFSSPENIARLDQLKQEHSKLADPSVSSGLDIKTMPLVVTMGYSIHGNESSGVNASLLTAYYLAAAEGPEIEALLENTIFLIDPSLNPDGLTRFATWANMHKSQVVSPDPANRAFSEVWPGGRTNHYWYDLNRDYVLLTNPETKGRVKKILEWIPNIVTDHHEMGSNSTFFFQPGVPSRNNPLTPRKNYILTQKIGAYHAKALDQIGSYYFTEEIFDDYYLGKGSSYPDINSGIGILFEQASVRGFKRETPTGILTFPYAIKNQFTVSLSTMEAARHLKNDLLEYQREFYSTAFAEADRDPVKAYVFGNPDDASRTMEFMKILKGHDIEIFNIQQSYASGNTSFESGSSYMVPLKQKQYRLIKSLFEPAGEFKDSTFYDVSTWVLPLSFNLSYAPVTNAKLLSGLQGKQIADIRVTEGHILGSNNPVAWAFRWNDYYAPRVLSNLLSKGLHLKVATSKFTYRDDGMTGAFDYGTILIPVHGQSIDPETIRELVEKFAKETGIDFYAFGTGLTPTGIDLGSGSFANLKKPGILLLIGEGTSSRDAGEIWHLFDTRYKTPITMVEARRINRMDLSKYNTIILPGGSMGTVSETGTENLKTWLRKGGTLIAYKGASNWVASHELMKLEFKESVPRSKEKHYSYAQRYKEFSAQSISGAIFEVELDRTHPLAYGFQTNILPVFKSGSTVAEMPSDPYKAPIVYSSKPLLSGFASGENVNRIKGAPFAVVQNSGSGVVIAILDNTNFRGSWFGTNKILANAVFFGHLMGRSSRFYGQDTQEE